VTSRLAESEIGTPREWRKSVHFAAIRPRSSRIISHLASFAVPILHRPENAVPVNDGRRATRQFIPKKIAASRYGRIQPAKTRFYSRVPLGSREEPSIPIGSRESGLLISCLAPQSSNPGQLGLPESAGAEGAGTRPAPAGLFGP